MGPEVRLVKRRARYFFARCVVLLHAAPGIIKDANEVAIQIGGHKLAQLPRFILGLGNDLRLRGLPLCEEFVHLSLAVEIEPEKDRAYIAVGPSEGAIGDKQFAIPLEIPAMPPWSSPQSKVKPSVLT
jgi:hypothetical protein